MEIKRGNNSINTLPRLTSKRPYTQEAGNLSCWDTDSMMAEPLVQKSCLSAPTSRTLLLKNPFRNKLNKKVIK